MGTFSNLFEVLRDSSYQDIEDESNREVAIALAGNTQEGRDSLHRALSTRLESLWTPSPFRLVENNERPTLAKEDGAQGGLLLYAIYQGDRIPGEKRRWLKDLAVTGGISIIVIVLDRKSGQAFPTERENPMSRRLQAMNPLRLVGGRESSGSSLTPAADGAAFNNSQVEMQPAWQTELDELKAETSDKLAIVELKGLELFQLQAELLPLIVERLKGSELALARRAPVFRNTIATHLISKAAFSNAELVMLANLTAGIPLISGFFSNGADFVLLTKNQFELSHRLAGVYGQKRDNRVEIYLELAPIIGGAFLWKTISSAAARRLPPFLGVLPKAAIAYGATFITGRLAQLYYAGGRKAPAQLAALVRTTVARLRGSKANPGSPSADAPRQLRSS